ncbi:MAG: hypothetical protein IPK17_13720 [Chloroflexi bacterium]|uniref:hypothetical protein n=1 Tax=Candidatus Flexifilum breve TaxID=3140694 RepID=UPI0031358D20|nr:hypothetical protein [Chloroflexota bacterium]
MALNIQIDQQKLAAFADKWGIQDLAIFDTHEREGEGLITDVMYTLLPGYETPGYFHGFFDMEDELGAILGRRVAMDSANTVKNYARRKHFEQLLKTMQVIYAR